MGVDIRGRLKSNSRTCEANDAGERCKSKGGDVIIVDKDGKVMEDRNEHEEEERDDETDEERERRRHRHRRSCSHGHVPKSVQKELRELRDLI